MKVKAIYGENEQFMNCPFRFCKTDTVSEFVTDCNNFLISDFVTSNFGKNVI